MKKCSRCKIEKSFDDFSLNQTRSDGLQTCCKLCTRILSKTNIMNMTDERKKNYNLYQKKWKKKRKEADPKLAWAKQTKVALTRRAKRKNLPCNDFTIHELLVLASDICPIFGIPLIYGENKQTNNSATIDRYVPSLGYVHGNICVISQKANRIKNDATLEELRAIRDWIKTKTRLDENQDLTISSIMLQTGNGI